MNKKTIISPFDELLTLVERKNTLDQSDSWSTGSQTYFTEIYKELEEVKQELHKDRTTYLEDELGDVLWDYLNLLKNLEAEKRIDMTAVFVRCLAKYTERINAPHWHVVKKKQKDRLHEEYIRSKKRPQPL